MLKKIISLLVGQFTWTAPAWVNSLQNRVKNHPKHVIFTLLSAFLLAALSYFIFTWYEARPRQEKIIAQITPPKITPANKVLVPDSLNIDFGVVANGGLSTRSVAPLDLVGKAVKKGIHISPEIAGVWRFTTDSHLIFTPSDGWQAGQRYVISFDKDFFNKKLNFAEENPSFTTLPFEIAITEFKFYQDPANAKVRQAVATIDFSYPVETASLDNKISLLFQGSGNRVKYTISYDENKRRAYLHSEPLELGASAYYLDLNLARGIRPLSGPSVTTQATKASLLIPDVSSYFKIIKTTADIIRNLKDTPEQIITIDTSLGIADSELSKNLHVYLLPQNYPATAMRSAQSDYQWQDQGEVTDNILKLSSDVTLKALPTTHDFSTLHSYQFKAPAARFLYIKIDKGTKGFGDLALANDYALIMPVPAFPKEISFLHKGALLALGSEEKVSLQVRGLKAVKFSCARILPRDINHLITQTQGDFSNPYFINYNFSSSNISEIFSTVKEFAENDPAKAQYTALDLKEYLANKGEGPRGLFLLKANGWNAQSNYQMDGEANRLILITDLGLITKDNQDGTHDVFVQSITQGTPVANVTVALLGKNGVALTSAMTDGNGHVSFPSFTNFTNEKEPTVYIATQNQDVSFIPYNRADRQLNYSRFDIGGVTHNYDNQKALSAYIFTERGIYRPSDVTHIGIIIKKPYALPESADLPLKVIITDPMGATVKEDTLTLNPEGFFTLDYQTVATSKTGQYMVSVYIIKDGHPSSLIGSSNFNVAEFLPDRMRISARLSEENKIGWISPKDLTATIHLQNLYGAPAVSHRIASRILLSPHAVTFAKFKDYTFQDPLIDPKSPPKVFNDTLLDATTNEKGDAQLDLKLDRFEKATYEFTLFAEGFEKEGGRSVTTNVNALVSPLKYLVGYKTDGDLNYIKQNGERKIQLIAINAKLQEQSLQNLKIQLYKLQPITTLVKKEDGTYQYQSLTQTNLVESKPFSIDAKGATYSLPTKEIGDYLIKVLNENGLELSKFKFNVVGASQSTLPKNAELNVKLNKQTYLANEEIELEISAPYEGAGLITIERDHVYAMQWFSAKTTTSIQKIKIPENFHGNGYVNVAFVRDLNSSEIFMNPLSYSVMPFAMDNQNQAIKIDLEAPNKVLPNDDLTIKYKTDKPSKIIVFAVDEGILQVSQYLTPDPLAFFFQKRALEVNTLQIVDQILPKFIADREISAVGGDAKMMSAELMRNLNPFKRKVQAAIVYWSGILDADTTLRELTYHVPDYFNGSLKIMAVAVSDNALGAETIATEVRGNFVINPNVPTFVAPNDEFEVTSSIANNVEGSGANAELIVQLTLSKNLQLLSDAKQTLVIPEGQERSVRFKLKALKELGNADLKIDVNLNDKKGRDVSSLSIRPPTPYQSTINSGFTNKISNILNLDRDLYPEYRQVSAIASFSPLMLLVGLDDYLKDYPYGCTEQLVSKGMPLLAMLNYPAFIKDGAKVSERLQQVIQLLSARQMTNGAFNYWPNSGSPSNNRFATLYALHFLTDAKEQGITISNDMLNLGVSYLKEFLNEEIHDLDEARLHAYAIYLLTRQELVTTNYLTHLQETLEKNKAIKWQNDITSVYIAATYQMLQNEASAIKMLHLFKADINNTQNNSDFYNKYIANAQYIYLITRHFPNEFARIGAPYLTQLVEAINNENASTLVSGYVSLAINSYAKLYKDDVDSALSINTVDANGLKSMLVSTNDLYEATAINAGIKQVDFQNSGKKNYFYQLVQTGFDKNTMNKTYQNGMEVLREYRNKDDNLLSNIRLGDEITVHVKVRSNDNLYHANVVIVDLLPGGFEVIRDSIQSANMEYTDIREDRVLFFGGISAEAQEITYRIKATNIGDFIVPPIFATSMYNPSIKAQGASSHLQVISP